MSAWFNPNFHRGFYQAVKRHGLVLKSKLRHRSAAKLSMLHAPPATRPHPISCAARQHGFSLATLNQPLAKSFAGESGLVELVH
jgi:hypothetical protein